MGQVIKFFGFIDRAIERVSTWILVVAVLLMVTLSVLTIVLRWFGTGLAFIEPLVRHLVFLGAFLGGVIATGRGTHIGIDIITKYFEAIKMQRVCAFLKRVICLGSIGTLLWLTHASINFVKMEMEYGQEVMFGLKSGTLVVMIPVGFALIACRYWYVFLSSFLPENSVTESSGGHV